MRTQSLDSAIRNGLVLDYSEGRFVIDGCDVGGGAGIPEALAHYVYRRYGIKHPLLNVEDAPGAEGV